jgi:electron transport complex protein RnfG
MKAKSNTVFIIRLALTLLIICTVVAALLAAVNSYTAPIIAKQKEEKTRLAIEAVLPGGGEEVEFEDDTGMVTALYASDSGWAVQVTTNGFGGAIDMMVGIDKAGKVIGISIISHVETPSLGAVAAENNAAGEAFRSQFAGLSGTLAVSKDGGTVDAISGATITSRAVVNGVNAALQCVGKEVRS